MKAKNLKGRIIGTLTVIERVGTQLVGNYSKPLWKCICECGQERLLTSHYLMKATTKSCGCKRFGQREANLEGGFSALYRSYKKGAEIRNYSFLLTKEEFKKLTSSNCFYCGQEPIRISKHYTSNKPASYGNYTYNGVDRWDNSLGYTLENSLPCCKDCNIAKGSKEGEEFLDWVIRLYKNITNTVSF